MAADLPERILATLVDTPEFAAKTLVWLTKDTKEWFSGRLMIVNWDVGELEAKKGEVVKGDKPKVRLAV